MSNIFEDIKVQVREIVADLLKHNINHIELDKGFLELGINSVMAVELVETLNDRFRINLGIEVVFDYRNITKLAKYVVEQIKEIQVKDVYVKKSIKKNNADKSTYDIEEKVKEVVTTLLGDSSDFSDTDKSFFELGINSVMAVELVEALNQKFGITLGVEVIFDCSRMKELVDYISIQLTGELQSIEYADDLESCNKIIEEDIIENKDEQEPVSAKVKMDNTYDSITEVVDLDVAIIGISGKFAGSETIEEFWNHLKEGDRCIEKINRRGWLENQYYDPDPTKKNRSISKWGGLLKNIDKFDSSFFNIQSVEAEKMDPQQRLFLQEAYKAFEDSGYSDEQLSGKKVGVFVGGRASDYRQKPLEGDINSYSLLGNEMSILATVRHVAI